MSFELSAGMIGGILGAAGGILGGIMGTYYSIRNTQGPLEKRFMIKAALMAWVVLGLFLGLLFWLPAPYKWFMWIPYGILLPLGIRYTNRRQQRIKNEETILRRAASGSYAR
jgi:uncharacterized membrane protein YfcA